MEVAVKWQINFDVQFNVVDRDEVEKIITRFMDQNETACVANFKIVKVDVGDDNTSVWRMRVGE